MDEKLQLYNKIKEKHKTAGNSDEQLHMWAYLLATKRHSSEDQPPAKRFFSRSNSRRKEDGHAEGDVTVPADKLASGSEKDTIMRQLRELCNLRYIGGLTEDEFKTERAKLATALATCNT